MRYQTSTIGETVYLAGWLPTGGTVTIILYDLSDGSTVTLDSASCTEIGSSGMYRWPSSNVTTQPTTNKSYGYIMTDATSGEKFLGKFVVGGYIDAIKEARLVELDAANIPADIDTLLSRLSAARAGYLDNLSVGAVALEATVQTILTDTNELQTDWTNGGRLDLLIDAIKAITDALPDSGALTTIDSNLTTLLSRLSAARAGYLDELSSANLPSDIDLILADTNELQTDLTNGGRLDLLIDAIKLVTDALPNAGALNDLATILSRLGTPANIDSGGATISDNLKKLVDDNEGTDFDATTDSLERLRNTAPLGTPMRGTDNSSLATVCTEARLAELEAANIPADIDAIKTLTDNLPIDTSAVLNRILGLLQENHYIDNNVYSGSNLTSARIRLYSDAASVSTDNNVIATYTLEATYSNNNNLATYKVIKD